MTELEKRIKAKIPGADTGIEIKHSMCSICTPGNHCGVSCYVKDGRLLKVEGLDSHPFNRGRMCTKGLNLRDYVYRADRIQTPLKRVGERGEGKFEPISWDEAYALIAEKLLKVRAEYSPHAVAFFSGYCKWYRPILHRLAHVFGSVNFGSDDSTCNRAGVLASEMTAGCFAAPDFANANTFLGWAYCGYYSNHLSVPKVQALKARGGKVIIIDSRITPASKNLADLFLHINPGTDGVLALGMGKLILDHGWADLAFIRRYTHGFEQYAELVKGYDLERVSRVTGLNPADILEAARIYATNGPACTNMSTSTLVHFINGFQTFRSILCLSGLTGNFDRKGGNLPSDNSFLLRPAGFKTRDAEFYEEVRPIGQSRIGEGRFPIWDKYYDEFQSMDLLRTLQEGTPYPVKAIFGVGMNAKMFPETARLLEELQKLDFFVNIDMFMTPTCQYADVVLPACSSLERSELKAYPGGLLSYTQRAIAPLYQSRSDVDILCELARAMKLGDPLLDQGYERCLDWIIEPCQMTIDRLKESDLPVKVPTAKPVIPGEYLDKGCRTPTGRFEFYSEAVAEFAQSHHLNPLPDYTSPYFDDEPDDDQRYPMRLSTGTRVSNSIHSRLHESPWARSLRPHPLVEVNEQDAKELCIRDGQEVVLFSRYGEVRAKAMVTCKLKPGNLQMNHGYTEANVNLLLGRNHLDPYSGFPGYKAMRCGIRKVEGER